MCTAATYQSKDFYFGRNLDYEFSYGEQIVILPRKYPLHYRHADSIEEHYAIIGTAFVLENTPLYYDAINEKGLGIAGLNFVGNAAYKDYDANCTKDQIAQFEFIPWILSQCASVREVKERLNNLSLLAEPFNSHLPSAQLHWLIADKEACIVVESMSDGLHVYDNPIGVLTNNPPFPYQMFALNNYPGISCHQPSPTFADQLALDSYSRGLGGLGIPGDLSSQSRFVKVAFTKLNSLSLEGELESVSQFFHILDSVAQQKGCCEVEKDKYEITLYSSCYNADKGIYYYTTYDNHQITGIDMHKENLDGTEFIAYPMQTKGEITWQN